MTLQTLDTHDGLMHSLAHIKIINVYTPENIIMSLVVAFTKLSKGILNKYNFNDSKFLWSHIII